MAGRARNLILGGLVAALLVVPSLAHAGFITVDIAVLDTFQFNPDKPPAENLGAHFHWTHAASSTPHSVTQDDKLFNASAAPDNSIDFEIVPSAGTYHYYCIFHGSPSGGMDGVIKVRPTIDNSEPLDALPFTVNWASDNEDTGNAFDVRYRVNGGDWAIWKDDTQLHQAVFGANDRPVHVSKRKTYQFEVRSEKKLKPAKHSDWSPPNTAFTPAP
jgi:plastocyanin